MIQDALYWFASSGTCTLPDEVLDGFMASLCSRLVSSDLPNGVLASDEVKQTGSQEIIIIANKMDFEASVLSPFFLSLLVWTSSVWETDFYTPQVLGSVALFDNSAPAVCKIQGP